MEIDTVLWFNIAAAPVFLHRARIGGFLVVTGLAIKRKSHRIMSAYNPNTVRFVSRMCWKNSMS